MKILAHKIKIKISLENDNYILMNKFNFYTILWYNSKFEINKLLSVDN